MKVLALIPARSGSKSIRHKNIRMINGSPLISFSIQHALASKFINRTIVSTDSRRYAHMALTYGAEVPFLRPKSISGDTATDLEVFRHTLSYLKKTESYIPDICVHLRPTCPIRELGDIDIMIQMLMDNPDADSIRSVSKVAYTPFKMWFFRAGNELTPAIPSQDFTEAYNMPRQSLPQAYIQNACIDVVRTLTITGKGSMTGDRILGYKMSHFWDIDTPEELKHIRSHLKSNLLISTKDV